MRFQPGPALFGWRVIPWVAWSWWVLGQVAVQRLQAYPPVVLGVGRAPPPGAVRAIQAGVGNGWTIADRAGCGNPDPRLWPGVSRSAGRLGAAGGQVVADEGNSRAGGLGRAAAIARLVAADVMGLAVYEDDVATPAYDNRDLKFGHRQSPGETCATWSASTWRWIVVALMVSAR